eukprot:5059325-Amphidinium_carterae.1
MASRSLLLEMSIPVTDSSDIPKAFWIPPIVNTLALIIMLNPFLILPFIELTSALLLMKSERLWDGIGPMRISSFMKATLAFLMDFGVFLDVYGDTFVTPLWMSSMRTPFSGHVLSLSAAPWGHYHSNDS